MQMIAILAIYFGSLSLWNRKELNNTKNIGCYTGWEF